MGQRGNWNRTETEMVISVVLICVGIFVVFAFVSGARRVSTDVKAILSKLAGLYGVTTDVWAKNYSAGDTRGAAGAVFVEESIFSGSVLLNRNSILLRIREPWRNYWIFDLPIENISKIVFQEEKEVLTFRLELDGQAESFHVQLPWSDQLEKRRLLIW